MKKEQKRNDKVQQEFESRFFLNTARNLIHGELLYQVIHGLQRRRIFQTSEPRQVYSCLCVIVKAN